MCARGFLKELSLRVSLDSDSVTDLFKLKLEMQINIIQNIRKKGGVKIEIANMILKKDMHCLVCSR